MAGQEKRLPEAVRDPGCESSRDEEPEHEVLPEAGHVHVEVVADRGECPRRKQPGKKGTVGDRHIHLAVALHLPHQALLGLGSRRLDHAGAKRVLEDDGEDRDHQQPAGELSSHELPAEQHEQDQAELEYQVGTRELEDDRVSEVRSLSEQAAGHRDRRIRAARARGTGEGREGDSAKVGSAEDPDHGAL